MFIYIVVYLLRGELLGGNITTTPLQEKFWEGTKINDLCFAWLKIATDSFIVTIATNVLGFTT